MTLLQQTSPPAVSGRMRDLLSRASLALLFVVTASPTLLLVFRNQRDLSHGDLLIVAAASSFSLALHAVLLRVSPRVGTLALLLFAVVAVPEAWFVLNYGWPFDANALSLIAETNIAEALDLLTSIPAWNLAFLGVPVLLSVLAWPRDRGDDQAASPLHLRIALLNVLGLIVVSLGASWASAVAAPHVPDATFPAAPRGQALALRAAYPAGLPMVLWDYYRERNALRNAIERNRSYRFGATQSRTSDRRRIYVLVIGETARADHLGVNGYARDTTPNLSRKDGLTSFTRMFSKSTFTRLSVPVILSRKPADSIQATFNEASIVTAFREAGFRTHWISLQAPVGYHESPVSVHANEADRSTFLNPVDYRSHGEHDDAAIPELQKTVRENRDQDLFVVIHTLGSHFRYTDRYPNDFKKFLPDRRPERSLRLFSAEDKEYLVNSYDNSILFTDHMLGSIIDLLAGLPETESWLFYVSDHGEALFDDCRMYSGHGYSAKATQSVAAIFWPSPAFANAQPDMLVRLDSNRDSLTSTAMMFETLASLGGINVPGARPGNDLTQRDLRVPNEIADVEIEDALACERRTNRPPQDTETPKESSSHDTETHQ